MSILTAEDFAGTEKELIQSACSCLFLTPQHLSAPPHRGQLVFKGSPSPKLYN